MTLPSTADTVVWRLHLRSDPKRVYELLSTDQGRRSFWSESAVEKDGVIEFQAKNGNRWQSKIVAREEPRLFVLDYGGLVTFELNEDGAGGTDLTLTHTDFDPNDRDDVLAGWINILLPLKGRADFDIDLRNSDPKRDWAHGYVDH